MKYGRQIINMRADVGASADKKKEKDGRRLREQYAD